MTYETLFHTDPGKPYLPVEAIIDLDGSTDDVDIFDQDDYLVDNARNAEFLEALWD